MVRVPAAASTIMYAERTEKGFRHLYPSVIAVQMCSPKGPVVKVQVTRDEERGSHHGWWDAKKQHFCMPWENRLQAEMCFAYGHQVLEEAGEGLLCRLRVEPVLD